MSKTAAARPMSKSEIAAALAERVEGVTKKQVTQLLEAQAQLAYEQASNSFTIPGIGKLILQDRPAQPARQGRNPATGEPMTIPAKPPTKVVKFRLAKAAKEGVLSPGRR